MSATATHTPKQLPWRALFALHLAVATAFAGRALLWPDAPLPEWLFAYAQVTAADQTFGYYAPVVASEWRMQLRGFSSARGDWEALAFAPRTAEGRQHLTVLASFLQEPENRRGIAGSAAAYALRERPDIAVVSIEVQVESIPDFEHYRQGERKSWHTVEVLSFSR